MAFELGNDSSERRAIYHSSTFSIEHLSSILSVLPDYFLVLFRCSPQQSNKTWIDCIAKSSLSRSDVTLLRHEAASATAVLCDRIEQDDTRTSKPEHEGKHRPIHQPK